MRPIHFILAGFPDTVGLEYRSTGTQNKNQNT